MLQGWIVIACALGYIGLLFVWLRAMAIRRGGSAAKGDRDSLTVLRL